MYFCTRFLGLLSLSDVLRCVGFEDIFVYLGGKPIGGCCFHYNFALSDKRIGEIRDALRGVNLFFF